MTSVEDTASTEHDTVLYQQAHQLYRAAGWTGPLPLPPGRKYPPPDGWTGYHGADPSGADSWAWANEPPLPGEPDYRGTAQLALRMPDGVIGVDVDDYGSKHGATTIRHAIDQYGPLPRTWRSTARGAGQPSGILFYRVRADTAFPGLLKFPEMQLADVELIQRHHRYAVAWPSVHPDTDTPYLWYSPDGAAADQPPNVDDLPWLPDRWYELAKPLTPGVEAADQASVQAFARAHNTGTNTAALQAIVDKYQRNARQVHTSRHDAMHEACCWAAREAALGRFPAADAIRALRGAFIDDIATGTPQPGRRVLAAADARMEFARSWAWAVAQADAMTADQVADRAARHHDTNGQPGGRVLSSGNVSPLNTGPGAPASTSARVEPPDDEDIDPQLDDAITAAIDHADTRDSRDLLRAALGDDDYADLLRRGTVAKVAAVLEQRHIRRLADEVERPPAEPIAAGALRWSAIATVRPPKMRVRRLLAESSVSWLSGRSGSYKSFLGVAIAMAVATGTNVCGHDEWPVSGTLRVLYIAAEGPAGVSIRAQAYAAYHNLDDADLEDRFVLYPRRVDLRSESGRNAVRAFVETEQVGMIVYDTWHKVTPGLDDNSRQEIGEVMSFLDELRDEHAVESLVVDHTGHAGERATGSSSKIDDADCSLIIRMPGRERTPDQQRTLVVDKLKDAETSGQWDLRLEPVPTVLDHDGNPARVLALGTVDADSPFTLGDRDWRTLELPARLVDALKGQRGRAVASDMARILRAVDNPHGMTLAEIKAVAAEAGRPHSKQAWSSGHGVSAELDIVERAEGSASRLVLAEHWRVGWPDYREE